MTEEEAAWAVEHNKEIFDKHFDPEYVRQLNTEIVDLVGTYFRPEFVNRIDEIVVFNPLEQEHVLNIARLQINELLQRDGFLRRTTILNISQDTLAWIAQRGYNKKMGGRALKRQIEKDLTAVSAAQLIDIQGDHPIIFQVNVDEKTQQLKATIHPLRLELAEKGKYWNPSTIQLSVHKCCNLLKNYQVLGI